MAETQMEQAILEAAERLFLERGFALISTTDIAREVGCNQSLLNYYFRSKERLFQMIFEDKVRVLLSSLKEPMDSNIPFLDKVRVLCEGHFDIVSRNPRVPLFLLHEIHTNLQRLESFKEIINGILGDISPLFEKELNREMQKGTIRETTFFDILMTMVSLNIGVFLFHPILEDVLVQHQIHVENMLRARRKENARILLVSLLP